MKHPNAKNGPSNKEAIDKEKIITIFIFLLYANILFHSSKQSALKRSRFIQIQKQFSNSFRNFYSSGFSF
jgi:hypothetical protein